MRNKLFKSAAGGFAHVNVCPSFFCFLFNLHIKKLGSQRRHKIRLETFPLIFCFSTDKKNMYLGEHSYTQFFQIHAVL